MNVPDPSTTFTNLNSVGSGRHFLHGVYLLNQFLFRSSIFPLGLKKSFAFLPFFNSSKSKVSLFVLKSASMASETEAPEASSMFERLFRHRELHLFLPFILGFSSSDNNNNDIYRENPENPDQETHQETTSQRERIVLINPFTQGMVVIEGASNLETLLRGWANNKDAHPPASKASIEAMPSLEIGESEDGECVVCLEEWKPGEVAKEMPCKHKFHVECIEKWLRIHGSCPVCRYKMPVDEEETGNKRDEESRRFERDIWVSFSFNSDRRSRDSDQVPSTDSNDVSSVSPRSDDDE